MNTKPLSEDVTFHCMGPWHKHDDGRECGFHNRLGVWTTQDTKFRFIFECTRQH